MKFGHFYHRENKVAQSGKQKKLCGFSFPINIANIEAFLLVIKLTKNFFFLKSVMNSNEKQTSFFNDTFNGWSV